jgi:hypothetical protein
MVFGPSNTDIVTAISGQNESNFKTVNNLLSLQENHVEEFFQYHGMKFLTTLEKLIEDTVERVTSQMLVKLSFVQDSTTGTIKVHPDSLREYEKITQENITLDIQNLLNSAIDSEVIAQRKMAKQQYLESQGFNNAIGMQGVQQANGTYGQAQQMYGQGAYAMNNGSGYPIPPAGQDNYGRPYWIDQQTGQMTYQPPSSGLGLGSAIQKGAAWAKWLM